LAANITYLGHVYTRDHNAFNASARAVLNVSRDSMAAYGYSPATRVFEAAGVGSCIITDAWEGISQFFEPGREILVAHNGPAVAEVLARLTPRDARRIGEAALARALAEHTYERRVDVLELALEGGVT
jgi:spore maturation protein CgeB